MRSYDTFNPTIPEATVEETPQTLPPVGDELKQSQKARKTRENRKTTTKKSKNTTAGKETSVSLVKKINNFVNSQSTRWLLGLFLGFLGVYLAVSFVSYLGTCIEDQSEVYNSSIGQAGEIANAGGEGGARLSEFLINECFGLGSFVLILWLIGMSLKQLTGKPRFKSVNFTLKCLVALITLSLIVGLVTIASDSTVNWGGYHGRYVNEWIIHFLGWIGALILSLFMVACFLVVCMRDVINWIIKIRDKRREKKRLIEEKRREELALQRELDEMRQYEDSESGIRSTTLNEKEKDASNPEGNVVFNGSDSLLYSDLPDFDVLEYSIQDEDDKADESHVDENHLSKETETSLYEVKNEGSEFNNNHGESNANLSLERNQTPDTEKDNNLEEQAHTTALNNIDAVDDLTDQYNIADEEGDEMPDKSEGMVVNVNEISQISEKRPVNDHTPMARHPYKFPPFEILKEGKAIVAVDAEEQLENKEKIKNTLLDFDIPILSIEATVGPTVTLYKIVPDKGVKVTKIRSLVDDIALSLAAEGVRIIAPIPGEGAVGIEVANKQPQIVSMRTVIKSNKFQETNYKLPIAIGSTISNDVYIADLSKMPHLLVAGATGQGKSVGLNAIITSLLYSKSPDELKFVMVDPKMVEFNIYAKIESHYLAKIPEIDEPIITDMDKVLATLTSLCIEMDNRYMLLKDAHARNIVEYNEKIKEGTLDPRDGHRFLPYIVVIVDEFSDLIMTAGKEVEKPIARLAQKARAVGMHVIIATQRPSTNVITGIIKANFPARIAFKVSSGVDSKTILDTPGAQQLIGRGDMLISNSAPMVRVQCAFIDTPEVEAVCDYIAKQPYAQGAYELPEPKTESNNDGTGTSGIVGDRDPLFAEAARHVVSSGHASTSNLQRIFSLGYNRAGKIMDQMESMGIVGPTQGGKPRTVLMDPSTLEDLLSTL